MRMHCTITIYIYIYAKSGKDETFHSLMLSFDGRWTMAIEVLEGRFALDQRFVTKHLLITNILIL